MDLSKTGKFISESRKLKKLTQEQLAEKLSITDRAVSKWERGLSLPDASLMLELCKILDISVNELLIGEKIDMKNEKQKTEELLVELAKQEEQKNKKLYFNMFVSGILIVFFYLAFTILACLTLKEGPKLGIIIIIATLIFAVACFYLVKMEVDAGYYECKYCHNKYIPTYIQANLAPHIISTRFMKCPKCGKKSWSKKVMTK